MNWIFHLFFSYIYRLRNFIYILNIYFSIPILFHLSLWSPSTPVLFYFSLLHPDLLTKLCFPYWFVSHNSNFGHCLFPQSCLLLSIAGQFFFLFLFFFHIYFCLQTLSPCFSSSLPLNPILLPNSQTLIEITPLAPLPSPPLFDPLTYLFCHHSEMARQFHRLPWRWVKEELVDWKCFSYFLNWTINKSRVL